MQRTWALTQRLLRQDARLIRFHLLRMGAGVGLALALWAAYESMWYRQAPGRDLLEMLAWANFIVVTIAGILLFAPTITDEKESQTLGLLRMTGIGPASLMFGSAIPKLVQLTLVLIVQLPLVWLTLTLGGVEWPLVVNVYLLVFGQLLGVVAISLLASVVMRTSGGAVLLAGMIVVFWIMGPMGIAEQAREGVRHGRPLAQQLLPLTESVEQLALQKNLEQLLQSGAMPPGTWSALTANLLPTLIVSLFAWGTFDYWNAYETRQTELEWLSAQWERIWFRVKRFQTWGRRSTKASVEAGAEMKTGPSVATSTAVHPEIPPAGRGRPSFRSWDNAIAWKDYFLLGGGWTGFRIRCVLAGTGVLLSLCFTTNLWRAIVLGDLEYWGTSPWRSYASEAIMGSSAWVFSLDLMYLTVNLFGRELRRNTWESMQVLPLSLGAICRRKILGAACHLVPWVVAFLCGLALVTSIDDLRSFVQEFSRDPLMAVGGCLQSVLFFTTALNLLTWFSLRFNPWIAILLTGAVAWGVGVVWIISLFMTYGFMSPPRPYPYQFLFHAGWISGASIFNGGMLWSIRSRLGGDVASVSSGG